MVSFDPHSHISCAVSHNAAGSWIINTVASDHMTFDLSLFSNTKTLSTPISITLPDGTLKPATIMGNIPLTSTLTLQSVLYIPDFKYNLLSVDKFLTDNHYCGIFYPSHCVFQDLSTKITVAVGQKAGGLYILDLPSKDNSSLFSSLVPSFSVPCNKSSSSTATIDVLHAWLGHTSISKMQHISDCKPYLSDTFTCDTCVVAKFHRLPFNTSSISTTKASQLIHMDLWAPYRVPSVTGAKYFLTIVDDFTRTTWTFMLQDKTQVAFTSKSFYFMIETQFNAKISTIRSYNGTEFIQSSCLDFFLPKVFYIKSLW